MKRIQISEINFNKPDFSNAKKNKENILFEWFLAWLNFGLKNGSIHYGDLLPKKSEFSSAFKISLGTVQNAIRRAQEAGYFESKQSIGTIVKNPNETPFFEKTTSKTNDVTAKICHYISQSGIFVGQEIMPIKKIAKNISSSNNMIRLCLNSLVGLGFLSQKVGAMGRNVWVLEKEIPQNLFELNENEASNLIEKTADKMRDFVVKNYKTGDKILTNEEFAKMFNVSIKTAHDASKLLNEAKILSSRRGKYGTIYINSPEDLERKKDRQEKSIFMSKTRRKETLQKSFQYSWERAFEALKKYIIQNHEAGDKIPSMANLAQILEVSTNTIRRAVGVMCAEGYLIAQRGKYGGVFVLEVPQKDPEAFTWLALNPSAIGLKGLKSR